jgi:hypothetical protein
MRSGRLNVSALVPAPDGARVSPSHGMREAWRRDSEVLASGPMLSTVAGTLRAGSGGRVGRLHVREWGRG